MEELIKGSTYRFVVRDQQSKPESFNGTTGTKYCHIFLLDDENGISHKCQIISDYATFDTFKIGDAIRGTIKTYTRGVYTIENANLLDYREEVKKPGPAHIPNKNPMIAGTIADRSLAHAIAWHGSVGLSFPLDSEESGTEIVLQTADKFHAWMLNKI